MTKAPRTMIRRALAALLVSCVLVALGIALDRIMVRQTRSLQAPNSKSQDVKPLTNPPPTRTSATALEASGIVEHRSAGGTWRPLSLGENVNIDDEVRTGASSRARLQLGSQVSVELADNTGINIAQLSETLSRVLLRDGRVVSEVHATEGFRFRVQVQGNNSQAETSGGRFGALRRSGSPAAFAVEQGSLTVTGANKQVTLQKGEQTVVTDNQAPSAPTKLPSSLLLKLGKPPPTRVRAHQVQVTGETSPGAVVTVGTTVIAPNELGRFSGTVALVDGPNEIRVEVEDAAGRKRVAPVRNVTVDSRPPQVTGKVVW